MSANIPQKLWIWWFLWITVDFKESTVHQAELSQCLMVGASVFRGVMIMPYCVKPLIRLHVDFAGDDCGAQGCVTGLASENLSQPLPPELQRRLQKGSTLARSLPPPPRLPHEPAEPHFTTRMKKEKKTQALVFLLLLHTTLGEALLLFFFLCAVKTSCVPLIWLIL